MLAQRLYTRGAVAENNPLRGGKKCPDTHYRRRC